MEPRTASRIWRGLRDRVFPEYRDRYFERTWATIHLQVPSQGTLRVSPSDSFWRQCRELWCAALGRWLRETGMARGPRADPPMVILEHVEDATYFARWLREADVLAPTARGRRPCTGLSWRWVLVFPSLATAA